MTEPRDDLLRVIQETVDYWQGNPLLQVSLSEAIRNRLLAAYPQLAATSGSVERQQTYFNGTWTTIRRTVYATPWEDAS